MRVSRYFVVIVTLILFGKSIYPMENSDEPVADADGSNEVIEVVTTFGVASREDDRSVTNILMPVLVVGMSNLSIADGSEGGDHFGRPVARGSEVVIEFEPNRIQRTHDLRSYYNAETKTLDLSGLPIRHCDETFKRLFFGTDDPCSQTPSGKLFHFLETVPVENLILEHMGLKEIPVYIITYALASQTLRYVSLKLNEFNLPGVSGLSSHLHRFSESARFAEASSGLASSSGRPTLAIPEIQTKPRSGSAGAAMAASQFTSAFLQDLIPKVVDQAIKIQGVDGGGQVKIFKKIIEIHENLPPITIVDQRVLSTVQPQSSKRAQALTICRDITIGVASLVAGLLPFLIFYPLQQDNCSC